ncbi:MAG: phage tail sheath C-terminal domain-containing protein [bacterium]
MPNYADKAPGVYVEEVSSGGAPIAGAGTSTGGFIGILVDGRTMPTNPATNTSYTDVGAGEIVEITSYAEFTRAFGEADDFELGMGVKGFFQNGGTRAFIYGLDPADLATPADEDADADPYGDLGAALETALSAFEDVDDIALVAAPLPAEVLDRATVTPGTTEATIINEKLLTHCEACEDRFAILAAPMTPPTVNADGINQTRESEYGAIYFPFIDTTGKGDYHNPVGHIAGAYARVDGQRGVHKAPANIVLSGAYGVSTRLGRIKQGPLNAACINVIRMFGNSVTLWGARTVAGSDSAFKYITTRRVYNYLRESIQDGLGWAVFEPNDALLWARIRSTVNAFLTRVWQSGALIGDTAGEAFYVKCDAETTPSDVRDLGMVVTEIGVSIVRPAEFVIFRLSQKTAS